MSLKEIGHIPDILKHNNGQQSTSEVQLSTNTILTPARQEDFMLDEIVTGVNPVDLYKKINKFADQTGHGGCIRFIREVGANVFYEMRYYPFGLPVEKYRSDPAAYLERGYLSDPIDVVEGIVVFEGDMSSRDHFLKYNEIPPKDKKGFYRKKALEYDSTAGILLAYEPGTNNIASLCEALSLSPVIKELASVTHPNHRRKRLASTMIRDMTYILFDKGIVEEIRIVPHPNNDARSRLATGMTPFDESSPVKSVVNIGFEDEPVYQIKRR